MPNIDILGKFNSKAADGVIADSKQIKGSYMVVANTTELEGLSTEVAPIGTQAYVQSEGLVYIKGQSGWGVYEHLNLENAEGEYSVKQVSYTGAENQATGKGSIVIGHDSKACQADTAVIGGSSQAGLTYAEAQAQGYSSSEADWSWEYGYLYALGSGNQVKGWDNNTNKPIRDAFALGKALKVSHSDQFAIGFYNADTDGNLFEVGNGSSNNNRTNAFEVNRQGDANVRRDAKIYRNLNVMGSEDIGSENQIGSAASLAVGGYNQIQGSNNSGTLVAGSGNIVEASNSGTIGIGLYNTSPGKVVIGQYNNPNGANVFEVGYGSDATHRNNIFEVLYNGIARANYNGALPGSGETDYNQNNLVRVRDLATNTCGGVIKTGFTGSDSLRPVQLDENGKAYVDTGVTPSTTNSGYANRANVALRLGLSTVGTAYRPVYISSGFPTACDFMIV